MEEVVGLQANKPLYISRQYFCWLRIIPKGGKLISNPKK